MNTRTATIRAGLSGTVTTINGRPAVWRGAWLLNRITTRCWNHKYGCNWHRGPLVPYTGSISHGICPECQESARIATRLWAQRRAG